MSVDGKAKTKGGVRGQRGPVSPDRPGPPPPPDNGGSAGELGPEPPRAHSNGHLVGWGDVKGTRGLLWTSEAAVCPVGLAAVCPVGLGTS